MSNQAQQSIPLDSLSIQQLTAVKKQLDEEVDHYTTSFAHLATAQTKFRDCIRCVKIQGDTPKDAKKQVLVPLTNSLYVSGTLLNPDRVLVDVGTGFYIEKDVKNAAVFYEGKVKDLGEKMKMLEGTVQSKQASVKRVEEVLREKVLAGSANS